MKYVGINVRMRGGTRRMVVAFPEDLTHAIVAKWMIRACREEWPTALLTTVSAGNIDPKTGETFGRSESLGKESDPKDRLYFNNSDYGGHIL